ncbi:MAG: hypothetical protein AMXMBFR82_08920 [Candidatus Hydrogenedentota bacterium]
MKKATFVFSILVLGAVTAFAGTISVPSFNDGGGDTDANLFPPSDSATFITLKNNTSVTQTYTILYYRLTGADITPTENTFTIGGNAARGWRPVSTTDPNEGAGGAIPNTTGNFAASATILYTDSVDPSGRVAIFSSTGSSYAFALFPAQ